MRILALIAAVVLFCCPAVFAGSIALQAIVYPPLVYGEGGEVSGVAPDVVRAIQAEIGDTNPLVVIPWLRAYESTKAGGQQALFAIVRIPEREPFFKWVGPIFSEGDYFFRKRGTRVKVQSLEDARKVDRIAVRRDGYTHQALKAEGFRNLDVGPTYATSYQKLLQERVDLVLMGERTYYYMVKEAGLDPAAFERTDCRFGQSSAWLAFSRDIPDETVARWQAALDKLKANGTFDAIMDRSFRQ